MIMGRKSFIAVLALLTAAVFAACGGGGGGGSSTGAPIVTTGTGTSSTWDTATVTGTVNPNGLATTAWIEYGTDSDLSDNTATTAENLAAGSANVSVSQPLTGLEGTTTYYFQVVAQNSSGTTRGDIETFVTRDRPPSVETRGVDRTHNTAVLKGAVNPHGLATSTWFRWGTDPTLAVNTTTTPASQGSGTSDVLVSSEELTGLTPETTYYYTIVAESSAGTVVGEIRPFTTLALGEPLPDAGADQNVWMKGGAGTTVVSLDASGSSDPGGSIASYAWTQVGGTNSVTLTGADTATPTFTSPTLTYAQAQDNLVFQVVVEDNEGNSSADNVTVAVYWGYYDDFLSNTLSNYTTGGTGTVAWVGNKIQVTSGGSGVDSYFSRLFGFGATQTSKSGKFSMKFRPTVVYTNGGIVVSLHQSDASVRYRLSTVDDDNFDKIVEKRWNVTDNGAVTSPFNRTFTAGEEYEITITYDDDEVTFSAFGDTITLIDEDTGPTPIWFTINVIGVDGTFDEIKLERKP